MLRHVLRIVLFVVACLVALPSEAVAQSFVTAPEAAAQDRAEAVDQIKLFPNPASEYFQLTSNDIVRHISINNVVGKEIRRMRVQANSIYDVSDLQKGMYIVRLIDGDGQVVKAVRLSKR